MLDPRSLNSAVLGTKTIAAGSEFYRATRVQYGDQVFTPEGKGNGRFSPLDGRTHAYIAELRSAALLESALHEADGPNPRIYAAALAGYELHRVRFTKALHLIDLRDDALDKLGFTRNQLTGSGARHYACTRQVGEYLVGEHRCAGLLWTSRQGTLHAQRNPDGLASEVLRHESLDVGAVYRPDHDGEVQITERVPLVQDSKPTRFVIELANLLRIAIL